tara:strand:- start:429 stop:692 length:264 start_codon:yes stop_codon:yes gene_type:complete
MPRYRYQCENCEEFTTEIHSYKETRTDCVKCETENSLKKIMSTPYYGIKKVPEEAKVGELTQQFIEENRQILQKQKKETKERKHDKS